MVQWFVGVRDLTGSGRPKGLGIGFVALWKLMRELGVSQYPGLLKVGAAAAPSADISVFQVYLLLDVRVRR